MIYIEEAGFLSCTAVRWGNLTHWKKTSLACFSTGKQIKVIWLLKFNSKVYAKKETGLTSRKEGRQVGYHWYHYNCLRWTGGHICWDCICWVTSSRMPTTLSETRITRDRSDGVRNPKGSMRLVHLHIHLPQETTIDVGTGRYTSLMDHIGTMYLNLYSTHFSNHTFDQKPHVKIFFQRFVVFDFGCCVESSV